MGHHLRSAIALAIIVSLARSAQVSESHSGAVPPAKFVDVTTSLGVRFQHEAPHTSKKYLLETMGSGVALFDYDNDGRLKSLLLRVKSKVFVPLIMTRAHRASHKCSVSHHKRMGNSCA